MKRHCDQGNYDKKKTFNWADLQFQSSVHYHNRKYGSLQADMVLEKELRVLHLDLQATEETCHTGYSLSIGDLKAHP